MVKLNSEPETGKKKFCVYLKKFVCYTSIGADNIHHASNKATKLFGPHWDNISEQVPSFESIWTFCDVAEFNKRIKTVSKLA
jgi:hypothetical protein